MNFHSNNVISRHIAAVVCGFPQTKSWKPGLFRRHYNEWMKQGLVIPPPTLYFHVCTTSCSRTILSIVTMKRRKGNVSHSTPATFIASIIHVRKGVQIYNSE